MQLADRSVVVVGGGFGGLSTACYLADAGADVTVVEKNDRLGGRASVLERDGFRFDMGPSWYLMPDVFERFFGHFDRSPDDYYELEHLDPHYKVFFKDGDEFTVTADREATKATFEEYEAVHDTHNHEKDTLVEAFTAPDEEFVFTGWGDMDEREYEFVA